MFLPRSRGARASLLTDHMSESTLAPAPVYGILPATPAPNVKTIGISQGGEFYFYTDNPLADKTPIPAIGTPQILEVSVVVKGSTSKYGSHSYLDTRMIGGTPDEQYILRLPCHRGQWAYRSLLGCLGQVDLIGTGLKIQAKRGHAAAFVQVFLDPEGRQPVVAPAIGPEQFDLQVAVNRCRAALQLPPQFDLSVHD